jgi:cell division protein FtsZ
MREIREILGDARLVFLVSGLGGCTGSGLTPLVSKVAKEEGIPTISVIITPFGFEKSKHFYTGIALKKVKENSNAVIIADNDMISSDKPQMPISEFYSIINKRISTALSRIVESSGELNVGMNRLLDTITNRGYSILSIGTSSSINKAEEATVRAVESVYSVVEPDEANSAILHLMGDKRITANEVETSTSRLNTMLGKGSLEVYQGFNTNGGDAMTAVLLTSGFKSTKFDNYDPLEKILHNNQIDSDMDCGIDAKLSTLVQIE